MRIGYVKTTLISQLTIDDDIDFGGDYQCSDLAAPAAKEALRAGQAEIIDADINAAAAIALTKIGWGRIGISKIQFTDTKLLKGAGVGVNPTEIGIGTGATEVAAGDHTHTLADDTEGSEVSALTGAVATTDCNRNRDTVPTEGDGITLATKTLTFASGSRAVVVGVAHTAVLAADKAKCKLFAGGVEVAESAYIPAWLGATVTFILTYIGVLEGEQICKITAFAYVATNLELVCGKAASYFPAAIGIGSIKI